PSALNIESEAEEFPVAPPGAEFVTRIAMIEEDGPDAVDDVAVETVVVEIPGEVVVVELPVVELEAEVPVVVVVEPPAEAVVDADVVDPPIEAVVDPEVVVVGLVLESPVVMLDVALIGLIVSDAVFEVPPPGGAATTVSWRVPGCAMSSASTMAVSW